jgi:hypothetical protein|tara:strand:- start:424 stop:1365 length:942 start_codon:yes stop_codon:yes gene_type:complete
MPRYSLGGGGGDAAVTALNNATANELVTVGSTTTELDAEGNLTFDGSDMKLLEAVNNGNPTISLGGADAEKLLITANFDSGAQTLDTVEFATAAASGTADKGKMIFDVDGTDIVSIDDSGLNLLGDASVLAFGANSEITITHVHDAGLNLKHTATGDGTPIILTLQTGEEVIETGETLGAIRFQAPDESDGSDAILVTGEIRLTAESDHVSGLNRTEMWFSTSVTESAASKAVMILSSRGDLHLYNQHGQAGYIGFHHTGHTTANRDEGVVGIGASPSAADAANVIYYLPNADGSSGQVLSTNGSGTLSWVNN